MTAQKILRSVTWLLVAAIVVVTLGSLGFRSRTVLPVDVERALAFTAVGLAFTIAYPRHIWWAVAFDMVGAVGLEWLQNLRPDRHGREADALVKLAGAVIGLGTGWLVAQLVSWRAQKARRT